jgi:hypothetical protein
MADSKCTACVKGLRMAPKENRTKGGVTVGPGGLRLYLQEVRGGHWMGIGV